MQSRYRVTTGLVVFALAAAIATAAVAATAHGAARKDALPVKQMETILQAKGSVTNGVLQVEIDRTDIGTVTLHDYATGENIPIKPSFEINGDLTFQPLGGNQAFFNGDIPLKPNEVNSVIDAILANHLVFQAEHQHFYDLKQPVWFIHFRGKGDPLTLATEVHNVLKATSTPLPQAPPANPTTPLDPQRLKRILHGYDVSVGSDGVVTVLVAPPAQITIDGIAVQPPTNISTNVIFEPLNGSGTRAAVAPDFAMLGETINPVMQVMRSANWDIGCLYNQETQEQPQLFFSHQIKTGDPYQLAQEVRAGLDADNAP
jgi:uncharacterized protein DUF1259